MQPDTPLQSLFDQDKIYVKASRGKRFINYLLDVIFGYVIMLVIMYFIPEDLTSNSILLNIFLYIVLVLYYFITELAFKGRTLGKLITSTKAIKENGDDLDAMTALKRSFIRIIPFEALSALGGDECTPMHDRWSETIVIDLSKTETFSNDPF